MSQRQMHESEPQNIAAEELAVLTRRNRELETSLQAEAEAKNASIRSAKEAEEAFENRYKAREEELTKLVQTNMATTMHWHAVADQKNTALEKANVDLQRAHEMSQLQKEQLETSKTQTKSVQEEKQALQQKLEAQQQQITKADDLVTKLNSQLAWGRKRVRVLEAQVGGLSEKIQELEEKVERAKKETAKTPRWKILMGIGLLLAAGLLIATGVGAVIAGTTAAVVGLGYAAFGVGMFTIGSGFVYGVYKGIRACCFPPKQTADQKPDSSVSSVVLDNAVHGHHNDATNQLDESPVMRRSDQQHQIVESKRENKDGHTTRHYAANRYSKFSQAPDMASLPTFTLQDSDVSQSDTMQRRRKS